MPELILQELKAALPRGSRLLGLDLGSKTIGLAVSDGALMVASPIETIQRTKFTADATKLLAIVDGRQVAGIVVGLPVNMDGTEGPRCQSTRQFERNLPGMRDIALAHAQPRVRPEGGHRVQRRAPRRPVEGAPQCLAAIASTPAPSSGCREARAAARCRAAGPASLGKS